MQQKYISAIRFACLTWLPYRIVTAMIAFVVQWQFPPAFELGGPISMQAYGTAFITQGWLRLWLEPWYRWDTAWYILIAKNGYQIAPETIIYPPGYPLLIRLIAPLFCYDYLISALFIANLGCIAALFLFYLLVDREFGTDTARLTILLLLSFPAGFFLVAGYSESLFLVFALGAWLAYRQKRFVLTGMLGFLATVTRSQGWIIGVAFAIEAILELRKLEIGRKKITYLLERLPGFVGPVLGEFVYVAGMYLLGLGSVPAVFEAPYWNVKLQLPWETLAAAVSLLIRNQFEIFDWLNFISILLVFIIAIYALRILRADFSAYLWLSLGFILVRTTQTFVFNGILRYTLSLFPLFIAIAVYLGKQKSMVRYLLISISFMVQVIFLLAFASWLWVS